MRKNPENKVSSPVSHHEGAAQEPMIRDVSIPVRITPTATAIHVLKKFGMVFLGADELNPLLQQVQLPPRWQIVQTEHPLWTNLVDEQGRVRAQIFHKSTRWDERAHMNLVRRYGIEEDYERLNANRVAVSHVTDCDRRIHTPDPIPLTDEDNGWEASEQADDRARAWLDEHYPDWQDFGAYWE